MASIKASHNVGKIMALKNWEGKNEVSFVQLQSRSVLMQSWVHCPDQCLTEVRGHAYRKVWVLCRIVVSSHQ